MKQLTNYCWRSWSLSSTGNGMTWYVRLLAVFLTKLCSSSFFYFAVWWVGSYARKTTVFICKLEQYPFLVLILGVLKYEVIHMVSISRCGGLYLEIKYSMEMSVFRKSILCLVLTFRVSSKRKQHILRNVFLGKGWKEPFQKVAALIWLLRDHSGLTILFYYATRLLYNMLSEVLSNPNLRLPLVGKKKVCDYTWLEITCFITDVVSLPRGTKCTGKVWIVSSIDAGSEILLVATEVYGVFLWNFHAYKFA